MRSSWLYFASRSDRHGAPVLIWPVHKPTAMSAFTITSTPVVRASAASRASARAPVAAALRPIDALTAALEAARAAASRRPPRKPVGWLVQLGAKLTSYEPIFGAADGAMWERLVGPSQLVAWAAQAVSSLLLASYHEDTLGSAHLAGSLDAVLSDEIPSGLMA